MVCPKLDGGNCKVVKKPCKQKYEVKMAKYKSCKIYKKGKPVKAVKKSKKKKKRR
jgi:hypothetical protein